MFFCSFVFVCVWKKRSIVTRSVTQFSGRSWAQKNEREGKRVRLFAEALPLHIRHGKRHVIDPPPVFHQLCRAVHSSSTRSLRSLGLIAAPEPTFAGISANAARCNRRLPTRSRVRLHFVSPRPGLRFECILKVSQLWEPGDQIGGFA